MTSNQISWLVKIIGNNLELQNKNLLLLPLKLEHIIPLSQSVLHHDIWKYTSNYCLSVKDLQKYVINMLDQKVKGNRYPFVIQEQQTGEFVGSTSFYDINQAHLQIAIGFTFYGTDYQKTGINRNAQKILFNYCFDELQARRVEFHLNKLNTPSLTALQKIGVTIEGCQRDDSFIHDGVTRRDKLVGSILSSQWEAIQKQQFANIPD